MRLVSPLHTIEQMNDELRSRLRRLGVTRGARNLRPAPPVTSPGERALGAELLSGRPVAADALMPGSTVLTNEAGGCLVVDRVYSLEHEHGQSLLSDLLALDPSPAVRYGLDRRLSGQDPRDFVFLDTETTGLAGAGTLAFMVGVAFFDQRPVESESGPGVQEAFVVRQYFLRDHGDEAAMLLMLDELLSRKNGLVTFNGRTFDVPVLDGRYLMNRMQGNLSQLAHLDLLPPARRIWRARLGSCALGSLEKSLLGLQRSEEDVPGWMIPGLYADYLRTRDARPLARVFYHNRIDMLSMVSLATRVLRQMTGAALDDPPQDLLSLAKWQSDRGLAAEAEATLRRTVDSDAPLEIYHEAQTLLAMLYKRQNRRAEAVALWQQVAVTSYERVDAHVELAKHYEWHELDLTQAIAWTDQGIALLERSGRAGRSLEYDELLHRRSRLRRKLSGETGTPTTGEE